LVACAIIIISAGIGLFYAPAMAFAMAAAAAGAKAAVSGFIIGGLIGGLQSVANGNGFWDGAIYGAVMGALMGFATGVIMYAITAGISAIASRVRAANAAKMPPSAQATEPWPSNNGFAGIKEYDNLVPGQIVDRQGFHSGEFLAPKGTPFAERGLPVDYSYARPYHAYEVLKPIEVYAGKIAPAFGGGGGMQYMTFAKIDRLIAEGFLRCVI